MSIEMNDLLISAFFYLQFILPMEGSSQISDFAFLLAIIIQTHGEFC